MNKTVLFLAATLFSFGLSISGLSGQNQSAIQVPPAAQEQRW